MAETRRIEHDSGRQRWVILLVAYAFVISYAFTFQALPPLLSLIIDEMKISHAQAGLLMSLFALPGIAIGIPAGFLADRYGVKLLGISGLLTMMAGTAIVASGNAFPVLALGRFLSGAGASTIAVIAPQLLAQRFVGREMGVAMGIYHTAMPIGTIVSFNALAALASVFSWRTGIWLSVGVGATALLIFLLVFTVVQSPEQRHLRVSGGTSFNLAMAGLPIWLVSFIWMWFNAAFMSFTTFGPDFFIKSGFTIGFAGFLGSLLMWSSLVLSPGVGYLVDKRGGKEVLIAVGGFVSAILVLLIYNATVWLLPLIILLGVANSLVPTPTYALPPDVLRPERLGLGFGIMRTCLNIGVLIGPYLVGLARDISGSYQASFVLISGFALLVALTSVMLKLRRAKEKALVM